MLLRCGLLLAFLSCVRTRQDFPIDGFRDLESGFNTRFSLWPSVHNAATLLRIRREVVKSPGDGSQTDYNPAIQVPASNLPGANEGVGDVKQVPDPAQQPPQPPQPPPNVPAPQTDIKNTSKDNPVSGSATTHNANTNNSTDGSPKAIESSVPSSVTPPKVNVTGNGTSAEKATKEWDLSDPAAMKRGLIVFGGFGLLAIAYFIFYRTKSKFSENSNSNGSNESNQFRYGVLQSDDRRDNMELSRVPLTMESDDEEDEDLEIFDLEQKKNSLSYVNLQANDEDIVLSPRTGNDRDDLLLDIEDDNSDILINWSNNGSKAIL